MTPRSSQEDPQPVYRSREAALRQRIAAVEAQLRELRAELAGLPEVGLRRTRRAVLGLALIVAATAVTLFVARRPDSFTFMPMEHSGGWTLSFQF